MNEEDIEILESECHYLEELGYLRENNHFIRFNQALENLIKGYRELEEKVTGSLMYIDNECVRKSKIKEKIEEYESIGMMGVVSALQELMDDTKKEDI